MKANQQSAASVEHSVRSGSLGGRPKLFLHVGTHKTGTTSIQKFAATHRDDLRKRGIYYPALRSKLGPKNPGHHHLAHALSDESSPSVTLEEAIDFLETLKEGSEGNTILLSAEPFFRHVLGLKTAKDYWEAKKNYVEAVANVFCDFDVTIVIVFRRLDKYIQSLYRESVLQSRYTSSLVDFVHERRTTFDYSRHLEIWETAFGKERVMIELFNEQLRGRAMIDAFFAKLGFDVSAIASRQTGEANVSLSAKAVELKRRLNEGSIVGRQSLKLRLLLETMCRDKDFLDLLDSAFSLEKVTFDPSGRFRREMDTLVERFEDRNVAVSALEGWAAGMDQPVPKDAKQVDAVTSVLLAAAKAHFNHSANLHLTYAELLNSRLNDMQGARALERALEFEPRRIDLYSRLIEMLGDESPGDRAKVLRNASKELTSDQFKQLVSIVGDD